MLLWLHVKSDVCRNYAIHIIFIVLIGSVYILNLQILRLDSELKDMTDKLEKAEEEKQVMKFFGFFLVISQKKRRV